MKGNRKLQFRIRPEEEELLMLAFEASRRWGDQALADWLREACMDRARAWRDDQAQSEKVR